MQKVTWILMMLAMPAWTRILTFEQALTRAVQNNHQVAVARNLAAISENNAFAGNAGLLPQLSLSGGSTYSDVDGSGSIATSASASAAYTLFDGFGNVYRLKGLQAGRRLGRLQARDQIESTLIRVGEAYYAAASAWENWLIARELLEISRERAARAEKRSDYGRAGAIDVLAALVDLNRDSVTVAQARFAWDESRRQLNLLLNQPIDEEFQVDTTLSLAPPMDRDALVRGALDRNAEYLAAGEQVSQARYDYLIARAARLPRLDLSASYGLNQTSIDPAVRLNDPVITVRAGAAVSFNLFNGMKTRIQQQNARILQKNQEILQEQSRLNLEKKVKSAYEAALNSLQVFDLEKRSRKVAELNFQRTRELYQLGQVTTTQFREAQLNLIRAKSNLSAAKYQARLNQVDLLRLSGQLVTDEEVNVR